MTGDTIKADEALGLGLVNRVMEPDQLDGALEELLGKLRKLSPLVLRKTRAAFMAGLKDQAGQALADIEKIYLDELMTTRDAEEGLRAFLEKRTPGLEKRVASTRLRNRANGFGPRGSQKKAPLTALKRVRCPGQPSGAARFQVYFGPGTIRNDCTLYPSATVSATAWARSASFWSAATPIRTICPCTVATSIPRRIDGFFRKQPGFDPGGRFRYPRPDG